MSKKKSKSEGNTSKTDQLIDEALGDMGALEIEAETDPEDEIIEIETPEKPKNKEPVAKIDVQQYVEKEAYMRLAADFDNFRRRALKERREWERQGQEKILCEVLEVLDNFERGIHQAEGDESPLAIGMRMVFSQMENLLSHQGLERIKTVGEMFDPSVHDAVSRVEDAEKEDGTIVEEIRRGYKWNNRLLRPASVAVVKNS